MLTIVYRSDDTGHHLYLSVYCFTLFCMYKLIQRNVCHITAKDIVPFYFN